MVICVKLIRDTTIKKADDKIYISDYKKMAVALTAHGYTVTTGRERPI